MNPEERSSSESERTRRDLELKVRTLTRGASVMGQKIKKKVKELKEELEGEDDGMSYTFLIPNHYFSCNIACITLSSRRSSS